MKTGYQDWTMRERERERKGGRAEEGRKEGRKG